MSSSSRDAARRAELWTPRVWPGAVVVAGEVVGTWRRAGSVVTVQLWRRLSRSERDAVELEAQSFPLPALGADISVRWITTGARRGTNSPGP